MNKNMNELLMDIRKSSKLSRPAMEKLSGFKTSTIESYERGTRKPSREYIEFISLYFGYKKEYIENKDTIEKELNEEIQTIFIFQSIYNYTNEEMAERLGIDEEDYISIINILNEIEKRHENLEIKNKDHLKIFNNLPFHDVNLRQIKHYFDVYIFFALRLNIKMQCFSGQFQNNLYFVFDENKDKKVQDKGYNDFITFLIYDTPIYEKLSNNYYNAIEITPDYYANIIKQRNQPETVTPNTKKENIPDKYKEVLELLPYAPDSFIDTIIDKLKTMKESQTL